jgi:S-formylglutathione hydrolase FrmB
MTGTEERGQLAQRLKVSILRKIAIVVLLTLICLSCSPNKETVRREVERASGSSTVIVKSVDFYSHSLQRSAHYLIALPGNYNKTPDVRFPVLYLLHGIDGTSEDWIAKGDLIQVLQLHQIVVVAPDGSDSYYTNAALRSRDRYEDLIVNDLITEVEQHYRVRSSSQARGIGGISMGGYGAVKIAIRHSDKYAFAAGISAALDAPRREFAPRRLGQSFRYLRIFGPSGSAYRRENDVFALAQNASSPPFLFLACGSDESLLGVNRSFAALLEKRGMPHEYHEAAGEHSWDFWKREIPEMLRSADQHLHSD